MCQVLFKCLVYVLVTQACPAVWDPMDCSPQDSSVDGILQARILEWVTIPFSRGSSWPRDRIQVSCMAGRFFINWATIEPHLSALHTLIHLILFSSVQFSRSVCLTLCDPMNHSTPGLPVHHQLPEFTQTHIHRVGDASSHLILCRPLLLLPPIPPSIRVFSNESILRMRWPYPFPFGNHKFEFYDCESLSCKKFICIIFKLFFIEG